ncbi:MAG: OmpP1/FadL family transporter, partial [Gemmatimonadota bacterium]
LEATGATGVAGHAGVKIDVSDRLSFGARYLSSVELDYDGDATFEQVETGLVAPAPNPFSEEDPVSFDALLAGQFQGDGLLVDQDVSTSIEMPAQLAAGLAWRATERLTVLADYQWVGWSSFDRVELEFDRLPTNVRVEDYDDTHGVRLGADLALDDGWSVRAGFLRHGAAAPDQTVTPLLPEGVRNEITAGLGWTVSPGFDVDVAYQHIAQDDRRGRVQEPAEGVDPTVGLNSGLYTFTGHLIGTTVTIHF